ncbi:MAG: hypothetical protein V4661_15255 [Pseudomonadota bacterium]
MSADRLYPRRNVVNFFAHDVTDTFGGLPTAVNDNNCPYCGGVLEPGDKASDCSGSRAWPIIPFPKGWGASC